MNLLQSLRAQIEQRALPGGGWASGSGRRAVTETTCLALLAIANQASAVRDEGLRLLVNIQNPDGSWPAFVGDDARGSWVTSLAVVVLRQLLPLTESLEQGVDWLVETRGREGHWFWKWKFRTLDRRVQFNPDKFGWPWVPGTVSWVIPTALSLIALRQSFPCCRTEQVIHRIQLGTEMLRDRACPKGGWNAGNGIVFGAALTPHIDTTAIALIALSDDADSAVLQSLNWLRHAFIECSSAYSLAWAAVAFLMYQEQALDPCIGHLRTVLSSQGPISNVETLSLAAIAINAAEGNANPFQVV